MSHFSVVVCLPDEDGKLAAAATVAATGQFPDGKPIPGFGPGQALLARIVNERVTTVMTPWDENLEVDPWRDYESGEASDFWLYKSLKRDAEDYAAGTGLKPYDPDGPSYSSRTSTKTLEEQRAEQKADADLFHSLPDPITWADLARVHNERYGDEESRMLVDESGRAYTMSTRNKDAKWDYWGPGGQWAGYFVAHDSSRKRVLDPRRSHRSDDVIMPGRCDGGFKADLDLDALRKVKADEAAKTFAEWETVTAGTPDALPWSSFRDNVDKIPGYTIDQARDEYHSQPRIVAIQRTDFQWYDDPVAEFGGGLKRFVAHRKAQAVPGYATVTTDGRWMSMGEMGWFGMSTDTEDSRIGYWEAANAYIEALPADTFLVALDCHI